MLTTRCKPNRRRMRTLVEAVPVHVSWMRQYSFEKPYVMFCPTEELFSTDMHAMQHTIHTQMLLWNIKTLLR